MIVFRFIRLEYLLLFFFIFSACKKDKNNEPKPTMNGSNVMYYEIGNAQHYVSGKEPGAVLSFGDQHVWVFVYKGQYPTVTIWSTNRKNVIYDDVSINIPGTPEINQQYPIGINPHYDCYYKNPDNYYYADSTQSFITFTRFDDKVIAGTFVLHGVTDTGNHVIELTNGWFDIARQQ